MRVNLQLGAKTVSEETVFLTAPRFVCLPKAKVKTQFKRLDDNRVELTFTATALQHRFAFDLAGIDYRADDNFVELYPHEPKAVVVTLAKAQTVDQVRKRLSTRSLVDTY